MTALSDKDKLLEQASWLPPRRLFLLAPILAFIFSLAIVWLAGSDRVTGQTTFFLRTPLSVYRHHDVGQVFTPPFDGLHQIDVMLVNFRKVLEGTVELELSRSDGTEILEQSIDASSVRDAWSRIQIPALWGIAGEPLQFEIQRQLSHRDPVGVRVGPGSYYAGDGLIDDEHDPSFTVSFRAFMATPPNLPDRWTQVNALVSTLTAARAGIFGQPAFVFGLGLVYVSGLALLSVALAGLLRRSW